MAAFLWLQSSKLLLFLPYTSKVHTINPMVGTLWRGGGGSHHLTVVSQLINEHVNLQWLCGVISITNKGAKWMVLFISHIYRRWWQPYTDTKMWMHFYKNNSMLCNWWTDVSQSTAELLQLRVHWQGLSVNVVMLRCRVETRHFLFSLSSESSLKMTGRI